MAVNIICAPILVASAPGPIAINRGPEGGMMPETGDRIAAIVKRLASLPPEAQEKELARLERLAAKQEAEAHIRTLAKHQNTLAAAVVDTITRYSEERKG